MKKLTCKNAVLLLCLLPVVLTGCFGATTAEQRYYSISLPNIEQPTQSHHNAQLLIREVEISPVYNRPQMVYRISAQELQFFHQNNWADRPSRMLGQLLAQAITHAGIFRNVVERLGDKPPDFVLDTSVQSIEELQGGGMWFAHMAMTFRLARFADNATIWQFTFDQRRPLTQQDLGLVVRAMSEILDEQLHIALPEIDAVLAGKPLPARPVAQDQPAAATPTEAAKPVAPQHELEDGETYDGTNALRVNWRRHAQYQSDPTPVPAGNGAVFLPSLSLKPDREPQVTLLQGGKIAATGSVARRIAVPPGHYQVDFGSGPDAQHLLRDVDVVEGQTVIVKPDWAALDISVVDVNFVPFLGTYEIVRMQDHEYLGTGYGVNEELGQQTLVWITAPGLHKIIQTGSTYRARTNFSTVRLIAGASVPFTLVQDPVTHDFLAAGVDDRDMGKDPESHWKIRSSLGGSVLLNNRSEGYSSAPSGSGLAIDVFFDNYAQLQKDQHLWTTRLDLEEAQTLLPTLGSDHKPGNLLDGRLQSTKDRLYLNSVYIFQYLPWIGPYVRIGGESTLFNQYSYFSQPTNVVIQDANGAALPDNAVSHTGVAQYQLTSPLGPIQLKQGAGVNLRVLHNTMFDLDLRSGLGAFEYISRGQLVRHDDPNTPEFELRQVPTNVLTGIEVSALSQMRLSRYLQASTDFDMLLPFQGFGSTTLIWRNAMALRLSSFASLTYTFNVVRQPNVQVDQAFAVEQGLQLRFFYALR